MNKIVSFSLWGCSPKYCVGALKNARLCGLFYPDWKIVFYVGACVPMGVINILERYHNVSLIHMGIMGNWNGMFWRFLSADSDDTVISRDTDSRISQREVDAVNNWIESDKDFHIMRDHPWHNVPILGGMWGCRNGILKGIKKDINNYNRGNFYQVDQNFLRDIVYPKIKNNVIIHDEYFDKIPFPRQRNGTFFVGQPFDENDTPIIGKL